MKTSFHFSGACSHSFTSEYWATQRRRNRERHLFQWTQPKDIQPGVRLLHRIGVLKASVIAGVRGEAKEEMYEHVIPYTHQHVEVAILVTDAGVNVSHWPAKDGMHMQLLASVSLSNGSTLWVVFKYCEIMHVQIPPFSPPKTIGPNGLYRALVFAKDESGECLFDCLMNVNLSEERRKALSV